MLAAVFFMLFMFSCFFLSLKKGPFWGLVCYTFLYFCPPYPQYNWWAAFVPDLRWGWLTPGIWIISLLLHNDKLSKHKFGVAYWIFIFYILTMIITTMAAVDPVAANEDTSKLLVYCICIILIIKTLSQYDQLRSYILVIILMTITLVITTYTQGKFIHGRLENIGPGDAHEANELGVLLASILPLSIPFIIKGRKYEKIICVLMMPLMINVFAFTSSRSAFVSLIFSIFFVVFFIGNKLIKKYFLIFSIIAIPLFIYLADEGWKERISTLWTTDTNSEEGINSLSSGRWGTWKDGIRMAKDYPFGAAPGGYRYLSRFYMTADELTFRENNEYGVRAAHNSFLLVLVEQGALGLCIFLIICGITEVYLLKSSLAIKKMGADGSFIDLLVMCLNISFICTLCGGIFNSRLYYEFFWIQIALIIVASSFVKKLSKENLLC